VRWDRSAAGIAPSELDGEHPPDTQPDEVRRPDPGGLWRRTLREQAGQGSPGGAGGSGASGAPSRCLLTATADTPKGATTGEAMLRRGGSSHDVRSWPDIAAWELPQVRQSDTKPGRHGPGAVRRPRQPRCFHLIAASAPPFPRDRPGGKPGRSETGVEHARGGIVPKRRTKAGRNKKMRNGDPITPRAGSSGPWTGIEKGTAESGPCKADHARRIMQGGA
jgi:hypothetical protein